MSESNFNSNAGAPPNPKELIFKYLPYLPWIVLSLLFCMMGAFLKHRYSTPIYNVTGKLLVKNDKSGNGSDKLNSLLMLPGDNSNLSNEVEIIKSRTMAARVIRSLNMQQQYATKGNIRTTQSHVDEVPFRWEVDNIIDTASAIETHIDIISETQFRVGEGVELYNFGQLVKLPLLSFRLFPIASALNNSSGFKYVLTWVPEEVQQANLSSSIGIEKKEGSNVLLLSYLTENKKVGIDIVNSYMKEYQLSSLEDKKLMAATTASFINDQLDTLQQELGTVERNLQNFREQNMVFSPERQSTIAFDQLAESTRLIDEQEVKSKILDYLIKYIKNDKNNDKLVPSALGIEEPTLISQITEYNTLQLQKETFLKTTTPNNPLVANLQPAIEKTKQNILENLNNVRESYQLRIKELKGISQRTDLNIRSIPSKEKQLLEVTRRQTILQELYSFLLQKNVETGISSASTLSDIKIIEPGIAANTPVYPKKGVLYSIAIFFGLLIPILVIFLIDYLNDKVMSKNDITKVTNVPITGEIGHLDDNSTALIVTKNNRGYVAEQFRMIRSNLQYIVPKADIPVILVTSSFSGEGKSFVSTNLGAVMALTGKRTVILEMDIRKPKIIAGLNMEGQTRRGLTNYVIGEIPVSSITYKVPDVDNLHVIPCGPIPPNPAELLLDPKIANLFTELRADYDVIIVDTAPVGLVSDAVTLGAYCNASTFIVRHNYTFKKQIPYIDNLYSEKKLPNLSIVINDIKKGGSGYYGYGYGYGYSLGNSKRQGDYFEETEKKRRFSWFRKKR